jgi:hypothetical protein
MKTWAQSNELRILVALAATKSSNQALHPTVAKSKAAGGRGLCAVSLGAGISS